MLRGKLMVALMGCALLAPVAMGQDRRPDSGGSRGSDRGGPGGSGGGSDRGRWDPQQMHDRFVSGFREKLDITNDDDWKVIQPKLDKVLTMRRDAQFGGLMSMFGGDRRRGGNDGGDKEKEQSPLAKAQADLKTALDNKDASAAEIADKLKAYRAAKEKTKSEMISAQKDLKELLTQKQEAILVMAGVLD